MVSENLARELWQDAQLALGKQIREDLKGPWREVIGVVNDVRDSGVQEKASPAAYFPLLMNEFEGDTVAVRRSVSYIVRSKRAESESLLADVRQAVWSMNPNLPLANVRTLQEIYDKSLVRTSFTLVLLSPPWRYHRPSGLTRIPTQFQRRARSALINSGLSKIQNQTGFAREC
jgi:hypothetical protein